MADAVASKAIEGNLMGVQVPSPAPPLLWIISRISWRGYSY